MGDRVAVMKLGELQQVDTPLTLYDKPVNLFVAGFIGSPQMNLIEAMASNGQAKIGELPRARSTRPRPQQDAGQHHRRRAPRGLAPGHRAEDGGLPVDGHGGRGARRRRATSTAPAVSRARPATSSSGSAAATTSRKGDTIYVTTDPQQRARLRHRDRGAPQRLTASRTPTRHVRRHDCAGSARADATGRRCMRRVRRGRRCAGSRRRRCRAAARGRSWPMPSIEQQLGAGDRGRGGAAAGDVHHLVGEAVDRPARASAAPRSRGAAVGLGEDREHLAQHAVGADARGRRSPRPGLATCSRVCG